MNKLTMLLFVCFAIVGCYLQSSILDSKFSDGMSVDSGSWDEDCHDLRYKHMSQNEIEALSPDRLFEELVKEHRNHKFHVWEDANHDSEYATFLTSLVRRNGERMLPILTRAIGNVDAIKLQGCDGFTFAAASDAAFDIDRTVIRLRGTRDGQLYIAALSRLVQMMKTSGFNESNHRLNGRYGLSVLYLTTFNGVNETDEAIRDTFWIERKIRMSDKDLSQFIEFLIEQDPGYPSWTELTGPVKDQTRTNHADYPLQVWLLKDPRRFHEAYAVFKKG